MPSLPVLAQLTTAILPATHSAQPGLIEILAAVALSFALNVLIAFVYRKTHRGGDFSQDYVHSMMILGTVVSVVVMVVRFDADYAQATAFGIFAAFSVIRFRTTVAAARDISFLFVAMSAGLGVGARAYVLATVTTTFICAIIFVFSRLNWFAPSRASHRLRIRVTNDINYDELFTECFQKHLDQYELLSVESIQAGMMTELRYNVQLKDMKKPRELVTDLQMINGNNRVLLASTGSPRVFDE